MIKKAISYVGIYTILFNAIFSFLFFGPVNAEEKNNVIPQNKQTAVSNSKNYSEDRVLIKFKNDTGSATLPVIQNKFSNIGLTKVDIFDKFNMGVMSFDNKLKDVDSVISELKKINNIEYVEYDYIRSINYTGVDTNDTYSIDQWYLKSIKADDAWKIYNDEENKVIVGVNDTGLDYNNPELVGNLKDLSSSCKNDLGVNISGGCTNFGWNFEGDGAYNSLTAMFPENDNYDINGHGTHVAGTIGAVGNNGTGVIGVTQNANIMSARVETYHNEYSLFYVSNVIRALNFAVENGAKVVNASYGGVNYSQAEYDSIENAKNHGVLFVAAAGNTTNNNDETTSFYPASYNLDNIISVASIGEDDNLAYYSNYGNTSVDLVAPGGDMPEDSGILSTFPFSQTVWEHDMNSFSGITLSGTGLNWSIYNDDYIETNPGAFLWQGDGYTLNEDKSLIFDQKIDLTGVKFAKFDGHLECELQPGDDLEILMNNQTIGNASTDRTFTRSYNFGNVIIPIPSNLYTSDVELKVNFKTNSDTNYDYGCAFNDFKIIAYDNTKHSYKSMQGTSMATPVVVGVASMLWSYKPELSYSQVKDIIFSSLDILPSLNTKVLTGGKINAKNAIKELISRYGITKSGSFEGETFNTPSIVLNSKNLTLSGSTINITSTGSVMSLTGSTITGSGTIKVGTGTSNNAFSTSSDFDIVLKNINGTNLDYSGSTVYGESLKLDYTGNLTGSNLNLQLKTGENVLYDGVLTKNLIIPINSSFSGAINSYVYKNGDTTHGIGSGVVLQVLDKINIGNINFEYSPPLFPTYDTDNSSTSSSTGTILFIGSSATSTGVIFNSTGTLDIVSEDGKNNVILSLSGLTISSDSWNLIFNPPTQTTFSGTFSSVSYDHIEDLSYSIGNEDSELELIGGNAQVKLLVGTQYNGQTLGVFRSINKGVNYNYLTDCLVSNGICSFETDKFSLYTIGLPSDSVPNNFSFTDVVNSELSTENISNTITVLGTNTGSVISIINGFYSINSGLFTNLSGIVHELDQIRVKLISSAANSTIVNSILNIGGVSDTYSVTTKASAPSSGGGSSSSSSSSSGGGSSSSSGGGGGSSSSSGGGGGSSSGGGGGRSYPVCLDTQLTCRLVSGSTTTFKWYKKEGFTCVGGNLGKICDKSLVEKVADADIENPTIIVNGKELKYIQYENAKIKQIQALLFNKLKTKKPTILTYVLVNNVVFNLNKILTDKTLSKAQIKILKVKTITTYKKYLKEYKKLPNAQKTK